MGYCFDKGYLIDLDNREPGDPNKVYYQDVAEIVDALADQNFRRIGERILRNEDWDKIDNFMKIKGLL